MIGHRRRLTFQLTPLLDLLLIVIFAQYMEVRESAGVAEAELTEQREALRQERDDLRAGIAAREAELEARFARQRQDIDGLREEYNRRFQSILDQHQQAGQALAEAFRLPGELLEEVLTIHTQDTPADSAAARRAAERIRELLRSRGREFLEFAVRLDEMQKHVSVWEIHLQDNGKAALTDGSRSLRVDFGTGDEFVQGIYETSKSFAEPRTMVIVLLSWGDTQFGQRRRAIEAMPTLMERLRSDAGGTHWYDFSLLGFRPDGPVVSGGAESATNP